MGIDGSRRDFLKRDLFLQAMKCLNEMLASNRKGEPLEPKEDYFDSFEKCYPLLSEAGPLLMEEATKLGIQTEGKSKWEIAKEIFSNPKESKSEEK
jgi:hypothetical protein